MERIIDSTFIGLLNKLTLKMQITLKNSQLGTKKATEKGSSVEFSDYKKYTFGDDVRGLTGMHMPDLRKCWLNCLWKNRKLP